MKELYFTPELIDRVAREMLQEGWELHEQHPWRFAPERAALLVFDLQRYFLERESHAYIPSAAAIVPKVEELVAAFSSKDLPVVFTRHLNTGEGAGRMGAWWQELITREDPMSELLPELVTTPTHSLPLQGGGSGSVDGPSVIEKSQYDAFYKTSLEELLKGRGVEQVAISRVMAHLCCETTARAALRRFER
ncbi:MAG: isochorismatase family protein [Candidatus Bipolaricaulia bacterium]